MLCPDTAAGGMTLVSSVMPTLCGDPCPCPDQCQGGVRTAMGHDFHSLRQALGTGVRKENHVTPMCDVYCGTGIYDEDDKG